MQSYIFANKQTLPDMKTKSHNQKHLVSLNIQGTSHYAEGDPSKHTKPAKNKKFR